MRTLLGAGTEIRAVLKNTSVQSRSSPLSLKYKWAVFNMKYEYTVIKVTLSDLFNEASILKNVKL